MKDLIEKNQLFRPAEAIQYLDGSVVSRQLIKNKAGNVTLFAFEQSEGLSEHTAPFDALVVVLEGKLWIKIGSRELALNTGDAVIMEAGIPHALKALERVKFVLTMIKGEQ